MAAPQPEPGIQRVAVRFFAAAADAAGTSATEVEVPEGATLTSLQEIVAGDNADLKRVLAVSSYLVDGTASPDEDEPLPAGASVDVLPPFAGG